MLAEGRGKVGSFPETFNDTFSSRPFIEDFSLMCSLFFFVFNRNGSRNNRRTQHSVKKRENSSRADSAGVH